MERDTVRDVAGDELLGGALQEGGNSEGPRPTGQPTPQQGHPKGLICTKAGTPH